VGAHGTLGLLCDVTLKLAPLPRARASLVVPAPGLDEGLALGARLLSGCLVASALLLCDAQALPGTDLGAPYALVYTAEGLALDVEAELAQARAILRDAGAPAELGATAGSDLWAGWLGAALASDVPIVRLGVAPADLPALLRKVAPAASAGGLVADLASGLLYLRGLAAADRAYAAATDLGGYGAALGGDLARGPERWGHTPAALDLMRALKARWNPGGLLNPGAFLV
jgi:D-lactate dehydrogenase (cytochrome)